MKQVWVLAALLSASLVGSYVTWTSDEIDLADADKVPMFRADADDVKKLVWKDEDLSVEVEKKNDEAGEYIWVVATEKVTRKKVRPPGDTDADEDGETPTEETRVTAFKGNDKAEELWKAFSPLLALRELDTTGSSDKGVFGLDAPKATIEIQRGNGPLTLTVGGETWGAKDRYIGVDQKVYLVDDADLKPLQFGKTRLVDRNLHPLTEPDLDRVAVTRDGTTVEFVQKYREDRAKAFWARSATPDQADTVGATWLDKLFKLKAQTFVESGEEPTALEPVFTFASTGKGKTWTVEILKEPGEGASADYFARSSYSRALVKLTRSMASEAAADIDAVIEGKAVEEPASVEGTPGKPDSSAPGHR